MHIERVDEPGVEWDAYAESRPDACLGHAAAWARILREAYGLESCYLAARDAGGALCGILPLVRFRSLAPRSSRLVSLPYLDAAGVLADGPEIDDALRAAALELASETATGTLELRSLVASGETDGAAGLDRVGLVMPLEPDAESQWNAFRAKVRNQTRKAEKEGLRLADRAAPGLIADFYRIFEINMRDLGSPVHARRLFEAIDRHFGKRHRVIVTTHEGRPVGGLVAIRYGDRVAVPWASTLRSERRRCPNNAIYWEAIQWAIEVGAGRFDFGRSPRDGGTWRFKKGWGAEERPLAWLRWDAAGAPLAIEDVRANPLLARLSALWTRLPLGVANRLGPAVRRHLPS